MLVSWSVDLQEWRPEVTAAEAASHVVKAAQDGDVVLMHGYLRKTSDALPRIIRGLQAKGLHLGPLSEVLEPGTS